MNITPAAKHNLINVGIIILPTILTYIIYFLGGGDFSRDKGLGITTAFGFFFSFFAAAYVGINRGGWK